MARKTPTTSRPASGADVPFPAWKIAAVKALAQVNGRAILTTRDGFWTRLYVRGLSPQQAAEMAAREYDATHPVERTRRTIRSEPRRS